MLRQCDNTRLGVTPGMPTLRTDSINHPNGRGTGIRRPHFRIVGICQNNGYPPNSSLPDDVETLKAMLVAERAARRR